MADRVALLGDAAHAMTPNLGHGACQALEDAAVLAALAGEPSVETALAHYDAQRRPRSQSVAHAVRHDGPRDPAPCGLGISPAPAAEQP
ncbi:FAD-dependent monooxygenase [Streptomyces sp. NPDC090032]|uniref:FAD-dependent monooxygenase n=1 Tax=Streptomyces sp. NPDC090032 TaxID=3365925 RepID=UPI0037F94E77